MPAARAQGPVQRGVRRDLRGLLCGQPLLAPTRLPSPHATPAHPIPSLRMVGAGDQCGNMLTDSGMGGMDEMGIYYDHCLESLYPPGACVSLGT